MRLRNNYTSITSRSQSLPIRKPGFTGLLLLLSECREDVFVLCNTGVDGNLHCACIGNLNLHITAQAQNTLDLANRPAPGMLKLTFHAMLEHEVTCVGRGITEEDD